MSIFTRYTNKMLEYTGEKFTTDIDGECKAFWAVFDAENKLETDNSGQTVILTGNVITALTCVADQLVFGARVTRLSDEKVYLVREKLMADDGQLTRVTITEEQ